MAPLNNQQNPQMMQVMPNQGGYYQNGNWQMPMTGTVNQPQTQYVNQPNTQPNYQPQQQVQVQPQLQQHVNQQPVQQYVNSDRIWSIGEAGAKAYLVARNSEAVIWDSEAPIIYIKTVDANGRPSMVTIDYTIRQPEPQQEEKDANAEMADLRDKVDKLSDMFEQFMQNQVQQQQNKQYKQNYSKKEVAN